jgi:hypothetical protein
LRLQVKAWNPFNNIGINLLYNDNGAPFSSMINYLRRNKDAPLITVITVFNI